MKKIIASSMVIFMLFASILSVSAATLKKTINVSSAFGTGREDVTADIGLSNINSPTFRYSNVSGAGKYYNNMSYRFNGFSNKYIKKVTGDIAQYTVYGTSQYIDSNYAMINGAVGQVSYQYAGTLK